MSPPEALAGHAMSAPCNMSCNSPWVAATPVISRGQHRWLRLIVDAVLPKTCRPSRRLSMLTPFLADHSPFDLPDALLEPTLMSSPLPDPELLDAAALARLRELDPSGVNKLMERVISAYNKSLDRLLPELAAARSPSLDLAVVRHVSHTLKSSSASLGALALAQRCADIEMLTRQAQNDSPGDATSDGQSEGQNRAQFAALDPLLDAMLNDIAKVRVALADLLND